MDPAEVLKMIRSKLCALFGLDEACSDDDFLAAFDTFIAEAQEEKGEVATEAGAEGAEVVEAGAEVAAAAPEGTEGTEEKGEEDFAGRIKAFEGEISNLKKQSEDKAAELGQYKEQAAKQVEEYKAKAVALEGQLKEFTDKAAKSEEDAKVKMAAEVKAVEDKKIEEDKKSFSAKVETIIADLTKEGKLLPAEKDLTVKMLTDADRNVKLKFSDSAGKEVEGTAFDSFVAALNARPKLVQMAELSKTIETDNAAKPDNTGIKRFSDVGKPIDEKSAALDSRTRAIMTEKKLTYGAAMCIAAKEIRK